MLVSPRPGDVVVPGQTVWVSLQPTSAAETNLRGVRVLAPGAHGCDALPAMLPADCMLTLPHGADARESIDIRARASLEDGSETTASVTLAVVPAQGLVALKTDPRQHPLVFDAVGQQQRLVVIGVYASGATRDIFQRAGTTLEVGDATIVEIGRDGHAVALRAGDTVVRVRHGTLAVELPIVIRERISADR